MAGFVIVKKDGQSEDIETMFSRIRHRGPHLQGRHRAAGLHMAQAYLRADTGVGDPGEVQLPVTDGKRVICYDGQIGNGAQLAESIGVSRGAFIEERLLLALFERHGPGMLAHLDDAIFAFAIAGPEGLFCARDLLGIKTLFWGRKDGALLLGSELKALTAVTGEVDEFPAGHSMDGQGRLQPFSRLPDERPPQRTDPPERMAADVRDIIERSVRQRVDFAVPTGSLLSGGLDSSVIAMLTARLLRERDPSARLKTFSVGMGEGEDVRFARLMAEHIGSEHHELMITLEQMLEVLPEVVGYLESFDPSLVRSSVSNFFVSRFAGEHGMEVLMSGEGGDEIFCGYRHLQQTAPEDLFAGQMECLGFLHNNASLRLDRMNACNSIRVVAPLISGELFRYAQTVPAEHQVKRSGGQAIEKWLFRKAFESELPAEIAWRVKAEFSQGSGSAALLPEHFEKTVSDEELAEARARHPVIRSKEELAYFNIFTERVGTGKAVDTVGQWPSL